MEPAQTSSQHRSNLQPSSRIPQHSVLSPPGGRQPSTSNSSSILPSTNIYAPPSTISPPSTSAPTSIFAPTTTLPPVGMSPNMVSTPSTVALPITLSPPSTSAPQSNVAPTPVFAPAPISRTRSTFSLPTTPNLAQQDSTSPGSTLAPFGFYRSSTSTPRPQTPDALHAHAPEEIWQLLQNIAPKDRDLYFGSDTSESERRNGKGVAQLLIDWTANLPYQDMLDSAAPEDSIFGNTGDGSAILNAGDLLIMERRARAAFAMYKNHFPTAIWHCCKRQCFASVAIDPHKLSLLQELRDIHSVAEEIHEDIKRATYLPQIRRKGVGGSKVGFVAPTREQRERSAGIVAGTDRNRQLKRLEKFVLEVLPFLYGQESANGCSRHPSEKFCTKSICQLLGISRNFLYLRRKKDPSEGASDQELVGLVDTAGIRLRQHRRNGDRTGYPPIPDLPSYECGCPEPCLAALKTTYLKNEYKAFSACAEALNPRRKENQHLLSVMFFPLTNSPVKHCDNALSALYTVSPGYIAKIRLRLQQMCDDDDVDHRTFLKKGIPGYSMHNRHPIYKYGPRIREKIEKHLDFVLRADPAGADGHVVCRVYSPEINTKEKLRKSIAEALEEDDDVEEHLSESTLQRMIDKYLKDKKSTVSFSQNDHNACPICKTLNYATLQYNQEVKKLERLYKGEFENMSEPMNDEAKRKREELKSLIETKRHQENRSLQELEAHNQRDAEIRQTIKRWSDHFRNVERSYLRMWREGECERTGTWNSLPDHAIITHQDDMTKVDLPHFLVTVSGDITRWRYDVNAHVSSVNDECVVFSHEQGTGSKNASSICEMILLDHLVRCKGEGIKVVVSDNASVGKNWVTTVVLPQYMVDQGLAEIVFIVFLENNHGKWLADMLFGQMQTRRRKTTFLSIDDLLNEFESVRRRSGKVQGFAANPLSSVDFTSVFESLGYQTKPPKDFGFVKRNIHFAAACKQTAKENLSPQLKKLFGSGLPDDEGMRYVDVPAACLSAGEGASDENERGGGHDSNQAYFEGLPPLVVPVDKEFRESGHGVVAQRAAQHVGFNGFGFRRFKGYPELRDPSSKLVRQAWPIGLIKPFESRTDSGEPVFGAESTKCAPENWVLRKPVSHFSKSNGEWKARYPPRNMLNAQYGKGPRVIEPWIPTRTYSEPPFPIIQGTAAADALQWIAIEFEDMSKSPHILDILRAIFEHMGGREDCSDPFLQRRATVPSYEARVRYRNSIQTFVERNNDEPSQVKTVRHFFKKDPEIQNKVEQQLRQQGEVGRANKAKTKLLAKLFDEASNIPGGLDKFVYMMEKDMERYSSEERVFKQKQKAFDERRGLLPQQNPN